MSLNISGYDFRGPYDDTSMLEDRAGIYAVLTYHNSMWYILDIGESATVRTRIEGHDRRKCWMQYEGQIMYSVLYTPSLQQEDRMGIEKNLRLQYDPPCGKQ